MKNLIKTSKNIIMKKNLFTKLFLALILLTTNACAMPNNKESNIEKTEQEPFRFEKFKNVNEAKEVLEKMYPAGTDVEKLASYLENSGCVKVGIVGAKEPNLLRYIYAYRNPKNWIVFSEIWRIFIKYDENKKIMAISVSKEHSRYTKR